MARNLVKNFVDKFKRIRETMTKTPKKSNAAGETCQQQPQTKICSPAFAPKINTENIKFQVLPTPRKSESDKKEYKVIQLENGLRVCLISDKSPLNELLDEDVSESDDDEASIESDEEETEDETSDSSAMDTEDDDDDVTKRNSSAPEQKMAAAALCIGVGSFSDPKDIPGMAHFLEHMVFMGSEKFPEENDFDSFLSKRGGSDNASTDCEVTTFYFECLEKHFYTALDKFAQFFISPLMKRGSMAREREAIESEFQMALPSDTYKKEQLLASFTKIDCPANNFTWGNLKTLRDNVSDDTLYQGVHDFRKRHYSAHRMTLAVQARLPMDVLESYVLDCFSKVPSNDLPADDFKSFTDVFDTSEFTKLYYVKPTKNITQVELTWALPSLLHKYKSKPHQYVSWLLGDEGKGSLLSYLRKKVWVLSMSTGNGESGSEHNSMYALFTVSMALTDDGLAHLNDVIECVFSYINMLREAGPQERIYNEIKTIEDTTFRFAAEEPAVDYVEEIAENMQFYPPQDYITGSELYFEYDPDAIKEVLDNLTPRRMNIIVLANQLPEGVNYDRVEKWFGTKYCVRNIDEEALKRWENVKPLDDFAIPPPNQYLADDFTIVPENPNNPEYPEKVIENELMELWYRQDQKFKLPVAYYYFYLISPDAVKSVKSVTLLECFMNLLQLHLIEDAYPAQIAELSCAFKAYDKGLIIKVVGYNQKLHLLIELITKHLLAFNNNLTKDMFEAVKDKLIKYHFNNLIKPSTLAKDVRLNILIDNYNAQVDKFNTMFSVTLDELKKFADTFTSQLYVKCLVQGNVTQSHAKEVVEKFVKTLNYKAIEPNSYPKFRVSEIPRGETICQVQSFNKSDANSIVTNYYQSGPFSIENSVIIEVIMLIIEEPLFNTLRTQEQLGYSVSCSIRETYGISGFTITVNTQATKHTTEHVDSRIEEFIKQASNLLKSTTQKSFDEIKRDLIKTKQCVDVDLKEEVTRNWSEIIEEDYIFDRIKLEIKAIEALKIEQVREWLKRHTNREDCKKLSVQIVGFDINEKNEKSDEVDISDLSSINKLLFVSNDQADTIKGYIKNIPEFKRGLKFYECTTKIPSKCP